MTDSPAPRSVDATEAEREELGNVLSEYLPFSVRNRDACISALLAAGYRKPTTPAVLAKPEAVTEALLRKHISAEIVRYDSEGHAEVELRGVNDAVEAIIRGAGEAVKTEARTPGTVEVCRNEYNGRPCGSSPPQGWAQCKQSGCPIRTHKEG